MAAITDSDSRFANMSGISSELFERIAICIEPYALNIFSPGVIVWGDFGETCLEKFHDFRVNS